MYIYRALNECDINLEPTINGIFNKEDISKATRPTFDTLIGSHNNNSELSNYIFPDEALFNYMKPSLCYANIDYLQILANSSQKRIDEIFDVYREYVKGKKIPEEIIVANNRYLMGILSTINAHIKDGTNIDTKWISFSNNLMSIIRYYLNQSKVHRVAVVDSNINKALDDNLFALDLSDNNHIEGVKQILINKDLTPTSTRFIGFNYARNSHEIVYYNHIPKEKITAVISPLQVDLILNNMYNLKYLSTRHLQDMALTDVKEFLKESIDNPEESFLLDMFNDMYEKDIPLKVLAGSYGESYLKLIGYKKQILSKLDNYDHENGLIKARSKVLVLPEDYA